MATTDDDSGDGGGGGPLTLHGHTPRTETRPAPWAPLLAPVIGLARLLPSARNTKRGRAGARQFKLVMFSAGVALLFLGPGPWTVAAALTFALAAVFLPLGELSRRTLVSRLTHLQSRTRRLEEPLRLVLTERRLELHTEDRMDRRVLVDRPFELEVLRLGDDRATIAVWSGKRKKRETIWVCCRGTDEALPVAHQPIEASALDLPVWLPATECARLHQALVARRGQAR